MLLDEKKFKQMEAKLRSRGAIRKFVSMNGEITEKMMITSGKIPDDLHLELTEDDKVFIASFEHSDMMLGAVINTATKQPVSPLWGSMQKADAEMPDQDIQDLFIDKVYKAINGGRFEFPICVFMNDIADITMIPYSQYQYGVFIKNKPLMN